MVKWTSKKGKELQEQIKGVILSGDWGNIFAPGFDSKDFDYKGLRSSNSEWDEAFSAKQFQTNVKAMIDWFIRDHGRAGAEAADLGDGGGFGGTGKLTLAPVVFVEMI